MTNGQKFDEVNESHRSFFDVVIALADKVGFHVYSLSFEDDGKAGLPRLWMSCFVVVSIPWTLLNCKTVKTR